MTFDVWASIFTGMVASILLLNVVQWISFRERIYGLYTLYMLAWLFYFGSRMRQVGGVMSPEAYYFIRACAPMAAYIVYFEFADVFVGLRRRLPDFYGQLRYARLIILAYIGFQFTLCYILPTWQYDLYERAFLLMRIFMIVLGVYAIGQIWGLKDAKARYFIVGTAFLLVGGLVSMVLSIITPNNQEFGQLCWNVALTYMQIGIICELVCFSLGLSYRQRRVAIRHAIIGQQLAREREQHQREHLEAELAVQQMRQEMSEVQMRALQSQLNPHFLFNSLNALSALITEAPGKAEQFVDEMASVYRYLLQTNEHELTTLKRELNFVRSYYNLLETRYGQGVSLSVRIDDRFLNFQLPPLTLQLLLENAVKHNVVSANRPLGIQIATNQSGWLIVSNNLQRKPADRVKSTKKGLLNILTKYQMLGQPLPTVEEDGGLFTVKLPLIE